MENGLRCFAGATTAQGFVSCFDGIFAHQKRVFFIKGAPGVGKSGLMKRVGGRQAAIGHQVHWFHCSLDPESLDGLQDQTLSAAMLDATSPHACEPLCVGARDSLLNLGEYLNEEILTSEAEKIDALRAQKSEAFRAAEKYLQAALAVRNAQRLNPFSRLLDAAEKEILQMLPQNGSNGRAQRYFLGAHTANGYIGFQKQFDANCTVRVLCPFGGSLREMLHSISRNARQTGNFVIEFLDPLDGESLSALYLPQLPLFICGERIRAARSFDECFPYASEDALFSHLLSLAYEKLRAAKETHDQLERVYTPRMDFSRLIETESYVYRELDRLAING